MIYLTQNLWLETPLHKHAPALIAAIDENREHLSRYLPWPPQMVTLADAQNYLNLCMQREKETVDRSFMIMLDGELCGRVGLHRIDLINKKAEIGYWLCTAMQGKGIMINAVRKVMQVGFEELGLNRIAIEVITSNIRSRSIPEKLGFHREGILREAIFQNGVHENLALYSYLKSEWKQAGAGNCTLP